MDRKATAKETLEIMKRGTYETRGRTVDIMKQHRASVDNSLLFTPEQAETLAATYAKGEPSGKLPEDHGLFHRGCHPPAGRRWGG